MSLKTTLKALGDAIRGKAGVTGAMTLEQMTTAVNGINVGVDTSDANAAAGDLLSGKTAYVGGKKVTGTIPSKAAATFTPGTADQTIAAGMYLSGKQTIKGDANLLPENIAQGVSIFGVDGALESGGEVKTANGSTLAFANNGRSWINVSGLGFRPLGVLVNYGTDHCISTNYATTSCVLFNNAGDIYAMYLRQDDMSFSVANSKATDDGFSWNISHSTGYEGSTFYWYAIGV